MVSDSSDRSRIAVLTCISIVTQEVKRHVSLSKVILWCDGFALQFQSGVVFQLLENYLRGLITEWHAAHYGKGPMDGLGSSIKNVAFWQVKSGKVIINSFKEFCHTANWFSLSISALFQ